MKTSNKLIQMALGSTLLISQTGCIASLAFPVAEAVNMPLFFAGTGSLFAGGAIRTLTSGDGDPACMGCSSSHLGPMIGDILLAAGLILDQKNPGRTDELNPLPIAPAVAEKFGVTQSDLTQYNDELPQVLTAHQNIIGAIRTLSAHNTKISREDLNKVAVGLGFQDSADLETTLASDQLSSEKITAFANSQGLTPTTAKIYLKSIGIKI